MQLISLTATVALAYLLPSPASAIRAFSHTSPVTSIVGLLNDLKTRIEADGQAEQRAYDKYACWCEDTLASKAGEITASKDQIESVQTNIIKLKGDLGSHGAEIKQLKKDIEANLESQRESTEMRAKEKAGYSEEKAESEQCIGALESAITVLAGAGTGSKKGFLETLQEAQLLSVVAGIKGVLARPAVSHAVGEKDLEVVKHFVDRPEDFVGSRGGVLSAAQIANNPFGDYAPQSTQIQGILKSMYESFARDLEKANGEEAEKQKGFQELMATKKAELQTLQTSLQKQQTDEADKTKQLADSRVTLDDTKAQLEADEAFFGDTKLTCESKAGELAQRTRLRTEELQGINQAVTILSSPEAMKTFQNATTTFLQFSAGAGESTRSEGRDKAYQQMRSLATRFSSVEIARIATQVRMDSSGHFDKVIAQIDKMIELLRKEEQEDVSQRDWCQGKEGKNKNDMADINYDIDKATKTVDRLKTEATDLQTKLTAIEGDINSTQASMVQLIQLRATERADFIQAMKDDNDAVALLDKAITVLAKFYKSNGLPLSLAQGKAPNSSAPPSSPFESGEYGGRKSESEGIVAILKMVRDDYSKEIITGREADGKAQANFEKDRQAMQDTLDAYMESKASTEKELADLQAKITDIEQYKTEKGQDLDEEKKMEQALQTDCSWVQTHFQSRRDKRKAEIDGLVDAKNFLAGVDDGI